MTAAASAGMPAVQRDSFSDGAADPAGRQAWQAWRASRDADLAAEHGWLSLTGFSWLPTAPALLPGLPGRWWADGAGAHVEITQTGPAAAGDEVPALTALDGPLEGADVAEADSVSWLRHGDRVVELLRRGGRLAVRTRDPRALTRRRFTGVPTWPHDPAWVRPGRYTPADVESDVTVATARPELLQRARVVGTVEVELDGAWHSLAATRSGDGLTLLFHDLTNDAGSAPWRMVRTGAPAPDGAVEVDLNRAVNLPFAFTEFGTCPAPVDGNRLPVAVTAGERRPA